MLAEPKFREGFARLAPHSLSFDAWLFHTQIDELVDLAKSVEETTIVLDHVGGPLGIGPFDGRRDEVFQAWRRSIADIATWPWLLGERQGQNFADYPNLSRWRDSIKVRPAVIKGRDVMKDTRPVGDVSKDKERFAVLFGNKQYEKR